MNDAIRQLNRFCCSLVYITQILKGGIFMKRVDIINTIGRNYITENIENGEYRYPSAYQEAGVLFSPIMNNKGRKFEKIDIRFEKGDIVVLVETKQDIFKNLEENKKQLSAYVEYEKKLTNKKIISILASTTNNEIKVWRGSVLDSNFLEKEQKLKTMDEYVDLYTPNINNKEKVMKNTYTLNEMLHGYGINESLRSQFVGTCLLALKNGLSYTDVNLSANQIRAGITEVLEHLLDNDINKSTKLALLNKNIIQSQDVCSLDAPALRKILTAINNNILPFINDKSTAGQDLLNLFFITFNKYVGKADKNQAFTPDHITDFMCKVCKVDKNSVVLDPCCGSGAFLVRAMTQALDDCLTEEEQKTVKKKHLYGIEFEDKAYGLSTTNMLIHGDGNSNIRQGSCFDMRDWIKDANPNVVLTNPPFNSTAKTMPQEYTKTWKKTKEDPSKGLYFVKYILEIMNENNTKGKFAVILPVACAIGNKSEMLKIRKEILGNNTLDAVFTLPAEIFYPGASASACCMVFNVGEKHEKSGGTFFGYYKEDGFKKKKNLGRVEQLDTETGKSKWTEIEAEWLDLYLNRREKDGLSCVQKVGYEDEWLCEAYMKTDYSKLTESDFQKTLNNYLSYLVKEGKIYEA